MSDIEVEQNSLLMSDDRPIKPDQKYLDAYIQKINKIQTKPYLKRRSQPTLPCHLGHEEHDVERSPVKGGKTKAQIYEEIKKKNRARFGEKKEAPARQQPEKKKVDPKKMTVSYKPKKIIETEEYKKPDYKPKPKEEDAQKESKIQYEKLIQLYRGELQSLQREKSEFKEVASKLKFKQEIKQEQGLLFSTIRSQVAQSCIKKAFEPIPNQQRQAPNTSRSKRQQNKSEQVEKPQFGRTYTVTQIKKGIEEETRKLNQIKAGMGHGECVASQHRYKISQLHLLPSFSPSALYEFIDSVELEHNRNSLYLKAVKAFHSRVNSFNPERVDHCEEQQSREVQVKWVGEKRVSRHEGWVEVWTPGRQRLMQSQQEGYKVVWLSNGDVQQEMPNSIKTYYCHRKGILKVEFRKENPVYYHQGLQQFWWYLPSGQREIVFANGRKEVLSE